MTERTLVEACGGATSAVARSRPGGLGVALAAGVVLALLAASAGREPRFRELGLVVGG
jgi:hypothetical protein